MASELSGRLAVVTGASAGIGAAIARTLVAQGADLAAIDIAPVDIDSLRVAGPDRSQRIRAWRCDATRSADVRDTCAAIEAELGTVSILVNNVGGSGNTRIVEVEDMTDEAWDQILSLNLGSIMRFCRALVPDMKAARWGRIVNLSSNTKDGIFRTGGTIGARLPYVAAKAAIVGLTKQLAKDLGPFGITCNAVAPGFTLPDAEARITQRYNALPRDEQAALTARVPLGRPGSGDDMANAVCFLAGPRSGFISGEVLIVSGGA